MMNAPRGDPLLNSAQLTSSRAIAYIERRQATTMMIMARSNIADIQASISRTLNALPGVFSTVQWGGRAYKLPGPGGNMKKPRLLAHVWLTKSGDAVGVDFKLEKSRADAVVEQYIWIERHSFRTLAPSGWVTARISAKSQCKVVEQLLRESRSLYPTGDGDRSASNQTAARNRTREPGAAISAVARRIDAVLREKKAQGWKPAQADDFDE